MIGLAYGIIILLSALSVHQMVELSKRDKEIEKLKKDIEENNNHFLIDPKAFQDVVKENKLLEQNIEKYLNCLKAIAHKYFNDDMEISHYDIREVGNWNIYQEKALSSNAIRFQILDPYKMIKQREEQTKFDPDYMSLRNLK